jgi:hypothetical protein
MITSSGAKTDDSGTNWLTKEDFERLERSAVKVARSVLRGRRRSNALLLPDRFVGRCQGSFSVGTSTDTWHTKAVQSALCRDRSRDHRQMQG